MLEAGPPTFMVQGGDAMRSVEFANGQFYHIYNRGVDRRNIFNDKGDYSRFIHYIYEFNDLSSIINFKRDVLNRNVGGPASNISRERTCLVDVICFCLMPNHFHFILRQIIDGGISKFMHKLGTGYSMYFNKKIGRTGTLFEGRFKAIHIDKDEYLTHLSRYIHLNPVELIEPGWKEKGIKNWDVVNKFLEGYRWSSYPDSIGKKNFPSILNIEPLEWYFKTFDDYKTFVQSWIKENLDKIKEMIFE